MPGWADCYPAASYDREVPAGGRPGPDTPRCRLPYLVVAVTRPHESVGDLVQNRVADLVPGRDGGDVFGQRDGAAGEVRLAGATLGAIEGKGPVGQAEVGQVLPRHLLHRRQFHATIERLVHGHVQVGYRSEVAWVADVPRGTQAMSVAALVPGAWIPAGSQLGTSPAWLGTRHAPIESDVRLVDCLVIGAGQAGLTAAHQLHKAGFRGYSDGPTPTGSYIVLDAEVRPGGAWQHRWPTLTMETVHHIADLPGFEFASPGENVPAAFAIPEYFTDYEEHFDFPILRPVFVHRVEPEGEAYRVLTSAGTWIARSIINATGTWTRPFVPTIPGFFTFGGSHLHTQDYRGPEMFRRRRVAVIGGGMSAVGHLAEIATTASKTAWFTRREPVWVDESSLPNGAEVEASVRQLAESGLPTGSVVSHTGIILTPQVAAAKAEGIYRRREMPIAVSPDGLVLANGKTWNADYIIWATGFRPELRHLAPLHIHNRGGGVTMKGTAVAGRPTLHLLGYGPTASTVGARWGGRRAVADIRRALG